MYECVMETNTKLGLLKRIQSNLGLHIPCRAEKYGLPNARKLTVPILHTIRMAKGHVVIWELTIKKTVASKDLTIFDTRGSWVLDEKKNFFCSMRTS